MDINDLYQELIIDHGTHPKNFHRMESPTHTATGINPLCGDKVYLYLNIENGTIKTLSFQGEGCAISTASASIMTEILAGKTEEEAQQTFNKFKTLVTSESSDDQSASLGKLNALAGVRVFPSRVKCATLAWHTLVNALEQKQSVTTTEEE